MLFTGLLDRVRRAAHITFIAGTLAALAPSSVFAASSVTLAWDPSTGTNIAGYKLYYGASSRTYTNTLTVGTATSATISNLISGATYYCAATAYDTSNLESDFSNEVSYTNVVLVAPTIALTSPANNAAYAAPATVSLAASVTANGHSITAVQFYNGANLLGQDTTAPYAFTWSSVPAGSYSLTARLVYDATNTLASTAANVTVTNLPSPAIVLTSPANNAAYAAPAAVSLAARVTANGHSITAVQFYNGTNLLSQDTTAPYTFTWSSVAAGNYSLTARLVYDAGTTLDSTPAVNVLVAALRDSPPTISAISDQTTTENTSTAAIPFTIGDPDTAISNLTVYASSANPALVPTNNIVFGGSDSNRTVTLTPVSGATGTVAITVFVSDEEGLTTNTTFQLTVQPPALTMVTDGSGTISSGLNMQILTPGQVYTVTAVPAEGQEFAGWTGSITSSAPTLTFVMNSNLVLKAKFASRGSSSAAAAAGGASSTYNGLFFETNAVSLASAGSFTLSVTPRSRYSGHVQIGAKRYSFSGLLDTTQNSGTNVIARHDSPPLTLVFQIDGSQKDQVFGSLTDGTWTALLSGDLAVFGRANPAPFAGNYTLVVPGYDGSLTLPAGDGFGTVKVNTSGRVSFAGTLADGTKISQSASLSKIGYWPLYIPLYSGNGSLMSWLAFANNTTNDLSGTLSWIKQPGSKSKYYLGGFTCECDAFGSIYIRAGSILNLPTASLTFCGGSCASAITNSITIGPGSKIVTPGRELKLSFSASTGTFKGTFLDSATGKYLPFSGAVFQKLNVAYGVLFDADGESSEVSLAP
jgi:hypothetical protein